MSGKEMPWDGGSVGYTLLWYLVQDTQDMRRAREGCSPGRGRTKDTPDRATAWITAQAPKIALS